MNNSTHGLCKECLTVNISEMHTEKVTKCFSCQKDPTLLYNQDPYCTACYLMTVSSPTKSQISSIRGHGKNKSFYRPIDKSEFLKKSFLSSSGKLIRKIQKLVDEQKKASLLSSYLSKKALHSGSCSWEKLVSKVSKNNSIIYFFFGKTHIIGAFHLESVSIQGQTSVFDQEAGIFICETTTMEVEFSRVKSDAVTYSEKSQTVRFGSPSSFDIVFEKNIKVTTEFLQNFQWTNFFIYRP